MSSNLAPFASHDIHQNNTIFTGEVLSRYRRCVGGKLLWCYDVFYNIDHTLKCLVNRTILHISNNTEIDIDFCDTLVNPFASLNTLCRPNHNP